MSDYYDYHPAFVLDRPLLLICFVNQLARAVGNALSSTTGLPLRLLEDTVEHRAGSSVTEILASSGLSAWRRSEFDELSRLVRSEPKAVIVLGEGALSTAESQELAFSAGRLVYLYLSFEEARRLALGQSARLKASLAAELGPTAPTEPVEEERLRRLFTERRRAYERAPHVVDVFDKTPTDAAKEILAQVPQ